jgi:hypothetical protein
MQCAVSKASDGLLNPEDAFFDAGSRIGGMSNYCDCSFFYML